MRRMVGTVVRGIRTPIINKGDNLEELVIDCVLKASESEGFAIKDRDIIGITESVVGRAQGNYAHVNDIAEDIRNKFGNDTIGVIFPILSRNRFGICLKGIAMGAARKIVLMLSYPADEVGNHLVDIDLLDEKGVNPWSDVLTREEFRELFGAARHPFTGVDYIDYYQSIVEEAGKECEIIFSNNPLTILDYTKSVLTCDIHTRKRTQRLLKANGAEKLYGLEHILTAPVNKSGYNEEYGLLGSNKATDTEVKLFPRDCQPLVERIQALMKEKTGKTVEVLVYGDGAFRDPIGKIWELADPVVSPAYTKGLEGTPHEFKLKYLADSIFGHLTGEEQRKAITEYIEKHKVDCQDDALSHGTTPRRLTDLIGSLCDLTSGSGDKGTPVIYIQGYFDNFTTQE